MFDARGSEFWTKLVRDCQGRAWSHKRREALDALAAAVRAGKEPGEVADGTRSI
jgi:hypothetical protein